MKSDSIAFEWVRTEEIPTLNLQVEEYVHTRTGAKHYHLATADSHNAFLVAFKTVPQDSTGVAHILEHTVLCGSRQYPVRDPFFMMTRRSLSTFMNALTASDWTAYPFATENLKDFDNLLRVYLDAVFFPNLNPLDFAQEGHRIEFESLEDPESPLVFKGVVFNEMKGSMGIPTNYLYHKLCHHLFPTITYHYNSGGDPETIPELTYEQLKSFHESHYHPANAIFMTYGDIPARTHHESFETLALQHFEAKRVHIGIPDEQRYSTPLKVVEPYAIHDTDLKQKTHIVLAWLLGKNTDLMTVFSAQLLSGVLLDNSASPLRYALETTELGTAPSSLCGLDDDSREIFFACGVEGSEPEHAEAVEKLILDVLTQVAEEGAPQDQIEAVLHQMEFSQREIGGDSLPYGLQLALNSLGFAIHEADPVTALNIDPVLAELREKIKDRDFLPGLIRTCFLNNPHRVLLTLQPDATLSEARIAEENRRLGDIKSQLSQSDRDQVVAKTKALLERQAQKDDLDLLPKVTREDIAPDLKIASGEHRPIQKTPAAWYAQPTNGLVYQDIIVTLPKMPEDLIEVLPYFCEYLTEVGCNHQDYLATQVRQASVVGGMGARVGIHAEYSNRENLIGYFILSGKALIRHQESLSLLLEDTLMTARFDELTRIRELVAQSRIHAEERMSGNGHALALTAAGSGFSPLAALSHRWGGIQGIQSLKVLDRSLEETERLAEFADKLYQIQNLLLSAPHQLLVVSEKDHQEEIAASLGKRRWHDLTVSQHPAFEYPIVKKKVYQAWQLNVQVNFCAKVYETVSSSHSDAPILRVLGNFLRNGFLHRALREQGGAYGGGTSYEGDLGLFRFFSYRDPRMKETLADFDRAITWLLEEKHEERQLEEAVLGVISGIDRPGSPAGEAKDAFYNDLFGRTPAIRRQFREKVLEVTLEDLKRVGAQYFDPQKANVAIVTHRGTQAEQESLALESLVV